MVALFLGGHGTEVIKCIVVNLPDVFESLSQLFLSTFEMDIYEGKARVLVAEPNCYGAFVSSETGQTSHHLEFADLLNLVLVLLFCKHYDVASYHRFLHDWNELRTKSSLDDIFPLE